MPDDKPLNYLEDVNPSAKPVEEPKTPETPVEPVKDEEVEVDFDEAAAKIADEAAKRVIAEQQAQAAAEAKKAEDAKYTPQERLIKEYEGYQAEYIEKFGKDPTWVDLAAYADERKTEKALELLESKQAEKAREAEEARTKKAAEEKQTNDQISKMVDDELNELYNAGVLSKIENPQNPSDPGVVERQSLFKRWMEVNNERRSKGMPEINSAHRIAYGRDENGNPYWTKPDTQPPGYDAPIMGNRSSAVSTNQQINYAKDVAGKPWSAFKKGH